MKLTYVVCVAALVILSRSRTGWLLLAAVLLFVTLNSALARVRRKEKALLLIVGFCVVAGCAAFAVSEFSQISILMGKSETMSGRTDIWKAILPALTSRPLLGYGFRAFWLGEMQGPSASIALSTGYLGLANAENAVLQMWLELGATGVGLMLLMLFIAAKNALKCLVDRPSKYVTWCAANVFLTVLALVDGDKIMFPNTIEWVLFVVSFVALSEKATAMKEVTTRPPSPAAVGGA